MWVLTRDRAGRGDRVEAKRLLQATGSDVLADFVKNRSILSFEEYLNLFLQEPRKQARNAAQYLRDALDYFSVDQVAHPSGKIRRFRLFDAGTDGGIRVAGQEEVQNALYRVLSNFTRAGRINKLILLHGPNGSAKSTIVDALKRGMEHYSRLPVGSLYKINWVFPSEKLVKGSIGFSDRLAPHGELASYAHLDIEHVDVRISCEMKDHPLFLVPREQRRKLLEQSAKTSEGSAREDVVLSEYLLEGELCHKCRRIYTALLGVNGGDYLKVLRHIQVERFYISRRYQAGSVTVEPQMSVDAAYNQVTADRSQTNLPAALHNTVMYDPHGALVSANRGLIEYSDLLKRPLEAFKYLLGTSETGEVPMEHFILQLDEVLIASSNEKHLGAFKELPDFASFKGRIELIRVPYLRQYRIEREVYDAQITSVTVGKHVAPHATEVAALWAVLTRLKKPIPDRYQGELREVIDHLIPIEKLHLYDEGAAPDRLNLSQAKEVKKHLVDVYEESDAYPNSEGRTGASARENESLDRVDDEVRESMRLISEQQYRELFERYLQHVSHWLKGERMLNRMTGDMERPDEGRMVEMETIVMPKGEDSGEFRRGLIAQIGAHKLDNPDVEMDYARIFPDLFRRLRGHFFEERKRLLRKNKENILKFLSDERASLSAKEAVQVESTLKAMVSKYRYCENCAKDAIVFLMRKRYVD